MREAVDFGSWVAGWTALGFVVAYGAFIIVSSFANHRARNALDYRILVTGSRGKSGTVRLLHALLSGSHPVYSKLSGAAARELRPDGSEINTPRVGTTSVCELPQSMRRAAKDHATVGVFECMAVTPSLINLVQKVHIQAKMVIIPTIRLDHLEEEGLTEFEIGKNIFDAVEHAEVLVTGVTQPEILDYYRTECDARGIELIEVDPSSAPGRIPGHHPTNVAIALRVAEHLGVARVDAIARLQKTTFEPRALEFQRVARESGGHVSLVDIGSANDPESAWEAFSALELDSQVVVPVMVNRWERPLRAISFFATLRQHFALVGVVGTLGRWMNSRHRYSLYRETVEHDQTEFFSITHAMASDPERLAQDVETRLGRPVGHLIVVLVENNHEPRVERLRRSFERNGQSFTLSDVAASA